MSYDPTFQAANLQIAPITTILDSENDAIVRGKLHAVAESLVPKITEKQLNKLPKPEKAHIQKLRSNRELDAEIRTRLETIREMACTPLSGPA